MVMKMNKLRVDFDVVDTRKHNYGYEEKFISFNGQPTKYKAILKDGELIAFTGRRYNLIPNELLDDVLDEIAERNGLIKETNTEGWRYYAHLIQHNENYGVLIKSSVDMSQSFSITGLIKKENIRGFCYLEGLENIKRRHTPSLRSYELERMIDYSFSNARKYGTWLNKLDGIKASDCIGMLEMLQAEMPNKYAQDIIAKVKGGQSAIDKSMSLKDIYELISKRIWSERSEIRRKAQLFRKLNESCVMVCAWED